MKEQITLNEAVQLIERIIPVARHYIPNKDDQIKMAAELRKIIKQDIPEETAVIPVVVLGIISINQISSMLLAICDRYGVSYDLQEFSGPLSCHFLLTIFGAPDAVSKTRRTIQDYIWAADMGGRVNGDQTQDC